MDGQIKREENTTLTLLVSPEPDMGKVRQGKGLLLKQWISGENYFKIIDNNHVLCTICDKKVCTVPICKLQYDINVTS